MNEPIKDLDGGAGTVETRLALVFTDVVGSSAAKRAAALGPDASARDRAYLEGIQAKHLRLVRSAVAEHNGEEIMTIGDSFFLTFKDPVDAVRCAAAIQQRLRAQPIDTPGGPMQLRIGMHVGAPEYFENSWHGSDVDTAARAQSAASPQQIVVTEAARRVMGDPIGIKFRPLGTFALKGVGDVRLWDADYAQHRLRRAALLSNEQVRRRRIARTVVLVLGTVALAGVAGWRWRLDRQAAILASAAKQSIIVTDFENNTGDPVFDSTLTEAFTAQLEQSPALKLVSPQHLRQSMQYLHQSPDSPLTPELVREIGLREGVKAYLTGTIAKLDDAYIITVRAKDISTGDDIVSNLAQARDKHHVLTALRQAATGMRRHLGESLRSIQKLEAPLGEATTPSLEAFQAYALGDLEHQKGRDIPQAEAHYRQAVELDPTFAMAWARLGLIALNNGEPDKAVVNFSKAYQLSGNVSERERLYIEAHYYQNALGDLPKAIATLELAIRTYPLDFSNQVNLGIAYGANGQMEKYLSQFEKAARIDPHAALAQYDLVGAQLTLDKVQDAEQTLANMKRLGFDEQTVYYLRERMMLDFLHGDGVAVRRTLARAEGRPDEFQLTGMYGLTQDFDGRYRDAEATWRRAQKQVAPLKDNEDEAGFLLYSASDLTIRGKCLDAARQVKAAFRIDRSRSTLMMAVPITASCGDRQATLRILADLAKVYPSDTVINRVIIPQSRAALALAEHHPGEALQDLEGSKPFDLVSSGGYLRGMAYLDLHDGANAIQAFRSATRYRGASLECCHDYANAQLGLARAYSMTGDATAAKKAYQEFFTTWKTADPDLPQLVAAKKEFATLP